MALSTHFRYVVKTARPYCENYVQRGRQSGRCWRGQKNFGAGLAVAKEPRGLVSQRAHIYRWDRQGRKGQLCLVLVRGTMNTCLIKFEDGYTMVTSRNALKLANSDLFPLGRAAETQVG